MAFVLPCGPMIGAKRLSVRCEANAATQPAVRLRLAAANIPHPAKASYGGEDAYFISDIGGGAAGVADGVGGWQDSGINPADYSKMFMEMAKQYLEGDISDEEEELPAPVTASSSSSPVSSGEWMDAAPRQDPVSVLTSSASTSSLDSERTAIGALAVAHRLTRKPGSATACVVRIDPSTGELDAANLGDSGFYIIRNNEIFFHSPPLQHFFDCPFQFGAAPEYTPATDYAEDAEVYRFELQQGDVIILATDGALDNIWPKDFVQLAPRSAAEVQDAASAIASLAAVHGADPEFESPYAVEASEEGIDIPIWEKLAGMSFNNGKLELGKIKGGKLDDVTVVVGYVEKSTTDVAAGGESVSDGQDY